MDRVRRGMIACAWVFVLALVLGFGACKGDKGDPGERGQAGLSGSDCTVTDNNDGTYDVTCGANTVTLNDGTDGTNGANGSAGQDGLDGTNGQNGVDGDDCAVVNNNDGTYTVTCGDTTVTLHDGTDGASGTDGHDGEGYFPLEPLGVVGLVKDRSGEPVAGGTIYFVPAADVAALPALTMPFAAGSSADEPLEDLIAANSATYQQAVIGPNGRYGLASLNIGTYFVTFAPANDDHLPGGSLCRVAVASSGVVGTRVDIDVSSATPEGATFIGSGRCVTCHGRTGISKTMHRLGIWSPYEFGMLQDPSARTNDLNLAFNTKFVPGQTIYFHSYDGTRGMDKYKTAETDPGAGVSFTVTVRKTGSDYEMFLHNVKNAADPDRTFKVHAVYGGGVNKQRYMTKIAGAGGSYYAMLPVQFQHEGSESYSGRTSKVWRDYNAGYWYDETNTIFKVPSTAKSFEKNCISCHAVGTRVTGSDATNWTASIIQDPLWGDWDYDGNGVKDEVNLGCETCHGPGSAHWESAGQGKAIVSPSLLTPERENMLCGQCHSRPKGALGTDNPVNAAGWTMRAGTSRSEFLANYATTQLDAPDADLYATDPAKHSKGHHQQYTDFIRSGKYRNGRYLVACSDCHNVHAYDRARQLRGDSGDNAAACGSCHATQTAGVTAHVDAKLGAGMGTFMANAKCHECHMPKTAKTGAGRPGITGHWQNDVTSHMFDMPRKAVSSLAGANMPTGYTNACGTCHSQVP